MDTSRFVTTKDSVGEGDFGWREREGSVCTQVAAQSMQEMDVQRSVIEVYLVDKDHALYLLYKHCLCAVICTVPVIQALPLCCNRHCTCYTSTASVLQFQNGSMHVRILYKYKYLSS